jgi:hypothetical protein
MERLLDILALERRRFNVQQTLRFGVLARFLSRHLARRLQIGLVSDQHHYDVLIGMFVQLIQPLVDTLEGGRLGDVINNQRTDSATIVAVVNRLTGRKKKIRIKSIPFDWSASHIHIHPHPHPHPQHSQTAIAKKLLTLL